MVFALNVILVSLQGTVLGIIVGLLVAVISRLPGVGQVRRHGLARALWVAVLTLVSLTLIPGPLALLVEWQQLVDFYQVETPMNAADAYRYAAAYDRQPGETVVELWRQHWAGGLLGTGPGQCYAANPDTCAVVKFYRLHVENPVAYEPLTNFRSWGVLLVFSLVPGLTTALSAWHFTRPATTSLSRLRAN